MMLDCGAEQPFGFVAGSIMQRPSVCFLSDDHQQGREAGSIRRLA